MENLEPVISCVACGQAEACSGHSFDSDPVGYAVIANHKVDDHMSCHPEGCKVAGRSVHAHTCVECGELSACTSRVANTVCEDRKTYCSNCVNKLARMDYLAEKSKSKHKDLKKRMRQYNNRGQYDNITDAAVDFALAEGHSVEQGREVHGPHRPSEKDASVEKELPEWIKSAMIQIESGESDSFVPPSSVASNAKRGLELRRKHNRGGTEVGVARARDLSNRKGLSYSTVKRMKAYFDRHEVDKKGEGWGTDSAGYIAWLLWGGDSGRSWANKIVKQKEKSSSRESQEDLAQARTEEATEAAILEKAGIPEAMRKSLSKEQIEEIRRRITQGDILSEEEAATQHKGAVVPAVIWGVNELRKIPAVQKGLNAAGEELKEIADPLVEKGKELATEAVGAGVDLLQKGIDGIRRKRHQIGAGEPQV